MRYREIAKTGIKISEIGLGCWTIGGPSWEAGRIPSGWAPVEDREVIRAIEYAVAHGVTHFDNADVYGNGVAERLLARGLGKKSNEVVITSKVGWFKGTALHAYEPRHIRHQCEQSLMNLNREYIDLYYFHHGDFGKNDCYLDEACSMMYRLRDEGKIRCIGLSAYTERDFARLVPGIKPSVVQSRANIMDYHFITKNSVLMKLCEKYPMSFIAFSPLNEGVVLGKYSSAHPPKFSEGDHRQSSEKYRPEYLARAEKGIAAVGGTLGNNTEDLARMALQFILYHDYVAGVIPGFRNESQVAVNLAGADKPLKGNQIALIRKAFA